MKGNRTTCSARRPGAEGVHTLCGQSVCVHRVVRLCAHTVWSECVHTPCGQSVVRLCAHTMQAADSLVYLKFPVYFQCDACGPNQLTFPGALAGQCRCILPPAVTGGQRRPGWLVGEGSPVPWWTSRPLPGGLRQGGQS